MPKIDISRLRDKYGYSKKNLSATFGFDLQEMMTEILIETHANVTEYVFDKNNKTLQGKFSLPKGWIPSKIGIKKKEENGKKITDSLKEKLINNLKGVLENNPNYVKSKDREKGQMKPQIIQQFERSMRQTFENYTKIDPRFGVPSNIHAIATTEVRGSVNNAKHEYMETLVEENPNSNIVKTWIHNVHLLKVRANARPHHRALNGLTIPFDKMFKIKTPDGTLEALYPHDVDLPVGEIVNCQCECVYSVGIK